MWIARRAAEQHSCAPPDGRKPFVGHPDRGGKDKTPHPGDFWSDWRLEDRPHPPSRAGYLPFLTPICSLSVQRS